MMSRSISGALDGSVVASALILTTPAVSPGQNRSAAASEKTAAKAWTASRTPDGQPDLQGIWTNSVATPLERPAELGGKEFFTEQEQAENQKKALETATEEAIAGTAVHYDFAQFGLDPAQSKRATTKRISAASAYGNNLWRDWSYPAAGARELQQTAESRAGEAARPFDK